MKRARQQGLKGLEASVIGLVLVGCIAVGSGLGYWLDQRFGTGYWLPILFLVGAAAGFREMFRTISKMNEVRQAEQEEQSQEIENERPIFGQMAPSASHRRSTEGDVVEDDRPRPRLFEVPPPPQSSFAAGSTDEGKSERAVFQAADATSVPPDADTTAELIEKLLDEKMSQDEKDNGGAPGASR